MLKLARLPARSVAAGTFAFHLRNPFPRILRSCFPYPIWRYSGGREADLNLRTRLLRVDDHRLVRAHIHELVRPITLSGRKRKLLIFAHSKFLSAAPAVNERRNRLR